MGAEIGLKLVTLATEIAKVGAGLLSLVTVIGGIQIFTDIGGQGLGHFVRSYIKGAIIGAIFLGSFVIISNFFMSSLGGGA